MVLRNSDECREGRGTGSLQVDSVFLVHGVGWSLLSEAPGLVRLRRLSIPTRQGPTSHQLPDGEGLIHGHKHLSSSLWTPTR